jgi:hypothetical protein
MQGGIGVPYHLKVNTARYGKLVVVQQCSMWKTASMSCAQAQAYADA